MIWHIGKKENPSQPHDAEVRFDDNFATPSDDSERVDIRLW